MAEAASVGEIREIVLIDALGAQTRLSFDAVFDLSERSPFLASLWLTDFRAVVAELQALATKVEAKLDA